jgi:ligand-binding SRPBCC domain-containing protein
MPTVHLTTIIHAPIEKVFDAARSIDLHINSMQHTSEKAIAGRISGLIEEGETVTWQAKHLFATRIFTSKITALKFPLYFVDEMIEGDFKMLKHQHHFKSINEGTEMKDEFYYESPFGMIGKIFNSIFLTSYMKNLLVKRNNVLKIFIENEANNQ